MWTKCQKADFILKCFLYPKGISHEICENEGKYKNKEAY